MDISDLKGKTVSIRSQQHPNFEVVNGILDQYEEFVMDHSIRDGDKKFSFNNEVIKERINYTLFI